jgi:hypothetical protein
MKFARETTEHSDWLDPKISYSQNPNRALTCFLTATSLNMQVLMLSTQRWWQADPPATSEWHCGMYFCCIFQGFP